MSAGFYIPSSSLKCCAMVDKLRNRALKEPRPCQSRVRGARVKGGQKSLTCEAHKHLEAEARAFLEAELMKVYSAEREKVMAIAPDLFGRPL